MAETDLRALAKQLRQAGRKDLSRELNAGIARAMKPLKQAIPASARRRLPKQGGLNEHIAGRGTRISLRKLQHGMRFTLKSDVSLLDLDQGRLRHPVPGTDKWVDQRVPPGFFSDPVRQHWDAAAREAQTALDAVVAKLNRG